MNYRDLLTALVYRQRIEKTSEGCSISGKVGTRCASRYCLHLCMYFFSDVKDGNLYIRCNMSSRHQGMDYCIMMIPARVPLGMSSDLALLPIG
jgi:hypothetical protein